MYLPAGSPFAGLNFKDAPRLTSAILGAALAGTVFVSYATVKANESMKSEQERLAILPEVPQEFAENIRLNKCKPTLLVSKWESAMHDGKEHKVLCEPLNNNRDSNANLVVRLP